ncbi:FtsX-like permease family protein [Cellulomonas sp. S1-8]|uniref:FtsX-like permease family protein n=1 Tax=Cellulomonas sp. S1-8 TaxID=2904790 RepID=UPI0022441DAA|nr:FtsX-like permease family protein [Cellulomonas sp. S1-8]UZN04359.1 FtsX-like permease family protein [Cellulomonas sp. S1-8]
MRWRPRVLQGRLRDQAPVVLMVTAVAVLATALLGVLALLLHIAENDAVPTALGRLAPEQVRLEATVWVDGEDSVAALERARGGLAQITGDVPTTEETWQIGMLHALPSAAGTQPQLAYLSSLPATDGLTRLVTGRWAAGEPADGTIEVTVPTVAAEALGWQVGTRIDARLWGTEDQRAWVVVGTYESAGSRSAWSRDRLRGAGIDPEFNLPGAAGRIKTVAWGPLVVDPAALAGEGQVDTAYVAVDPQLDGASRAAVAAMREHLRDGAALVSEALGERTGGRLVTDAATAIDATWREAVVTRAGVAAIGLLLATLATTVMLLAARLLAERRAVEAELLAARGASAGQLRSVVVLEAVVLAGVTWVASPWLATWALGLMTRSGALAEAGYVVGPGVETPVLLVCAAMAAVLAVALCVPAWHTSGSSTTTSHAGLLRAGGDLALLAFAGLAVWQLVAYGSPLTGGPGGRQLDPVLVAGPALVTLAAATVALRLVGPVARGADLLAARARSFVIPLAAWQVARRSSIATGTVLVVVVAVAAGTFSAAFLATWRTSQLAQVDLALGTDLRVDALQDEPLVASAALAAATAEHPDAVGQPVLDRVVGIGPAGVGTQLSGRLIGLDTSRPQDVRGYSATSWDQVLAGLAGTDPVPAAALPVPAGTQWITVQGVVTTEPVAVGSAMVGLTVEDDQGVLVQLPSRNVALEEEFVLAFEVPDTGPLRIVAVHALLALQSVPEDVLAAAWEAGRPQAMPLRIDLVGVRTVPRSAGIDTDWAALDPAVGTPVEVRGDGWTAAVRQPGQGSDSGPAVKAGTVETADGGVLRAAGDVVVDGSGTPPPVQMVVRAWPAPPVVPAVVSSELSETLGVGVGRTLVLDVGGAPLTVRIERFADHLPGVPRGVGVLVDRTAFARAVLDAGGRPELLDSWWVAAPPATAAAVADRVTETVDAVVTTRAEQRDESLAGPVRVAVPAALSLVTGAAILLVLVGTGAVAAASLRARRTELARLQALGASRSGLAGGLLAENALLVVVGAVVGLLAGYGLAAVVAPLLTMSADGRTPVPEPWLVWQWRDQASRTLAVVLGTAAVVGLVAALGVRRASGAALRLGDDR